jgi:Ni/Fe-hydrogenase subunit HybB-like protein
MGRPDRLISVILHGRLQSPILWDVVSVTAYFLGSITYLYLPILPDAALLRDNFPPDGPLWRKRLYTLLALGWRGNRTQWIRLEKAIAVMAILIIPIAVSVHTIISWILATTLQPGWHSTIFGPYFVVGAIFSGIGALFIAMTIVRRKMGLQAYITEKQYRNLGFIFITMSAVWMYFTYAEHLTLAAGQEVNEFPVLASKLWGEFSIGFWIMVILMIVSFWIMVVPYLIPDNAKRFAILRPRISQGATLVAVMTAVFLAVDTPIQATAISELVNLRGLLWMLLLAASAVAGLGLARWFKPRPVDATLVAAGAVLVGMWLERWNIILPTLTHPYLAYWAEYTPTLTEIALTAASVSLFVLFFILFFKLFPVISIWEIAEGRIIDEEQAKLSIPMPQTSNIVRQLQRLRTRRRGQ